MSQASTKSIFKDIDPVQRKRLIEGSAYLVGGTLLAPRRIAKGAEAVQKVVRGEKLSYRDGYRIFTAVSAIVLMSSNTHFEVNRHLRNLRSFIDLGGK